MSDRHSERARRALFFARYEAIQAGSESIESEHLLLALLRDVGSAARELFNRAGLSLEEVRKEIKPRNPRRRGIAPDDIGHGEEVGQILQFAAAEADRLGDREVDGEHLLLGILSAESSVAASILRSHGIQLDSARHELVTLRSQPPRPAGVYIVPTERSASSEIGSNGYWALEGFDLMSALVRVASSDELLFPAGRIELPPSLDPHARYDFLLVHAHEDGRDDRNELMRRGIEAVLRRGGRTREPGRGRVRVDRSGWRASHDQGDQARSPSRAPFSLTDIKARGHAGHVDRERRPCRTVRWRCCAAHSNRRSIDRSSTKRDWPAGTISRCPADQVISPSASAMSLDSR